MYLAPKGHAVTIDGWGIEIHRDTYTCKHCQRVCEVEPRADPNEFWCASCAAPVCKRCKAADWNRPAGAPCGHFERQLDAAEARDRLRRAMYG